MKAKAVKAKAVKAKAVKAKAVKAKAVKAKAVKAKAVEAEAVKVQAWRLAVYKPGRSVYISDPTISIRRCKSLAAGKSIYKDFVARRPDAAEQDAAHDNRHRKPCVRMAVIVLTWLKLAKTNIFFPDEGARACIRELSFAFMGETGG